MSTDKPVIVYGVIGYTGRLICEYLRELDVPSSPPAATRIAGTRSWTKSRASRPPTTKSPRWTQRRSARRVFDGAKVVCNMVGPFSKYGPEVAEACLAAGCHYTDTTGEQDWVLDAKTRWGAEVRRQGPAALARHRADVHDRRNRREHLPGDAGRRHARHPGAVEGLSRLTPRPRRSSRSSRRNGTTSSRTSSSNGPQTRHFDVNVPGQHARALAPPWGGTSHPVWFKDDPRVANCKALGGVFAAKSWRASSRR